MKRVIFLIMSILAGSALQAHTTAQDTVVVDRKMVNSGVDFFVPHWYGRLMAGPSADVGESRFYRIMSPEVMATMGYRFSEPFALRLSVNGFWGRNRYVFPAFGYRWNYAMSTLGIELHLKPIFWGDRPADSWSPYASLDLGAAVSWGNTTAVREARRSDVGFEKLWTDHRWHPAARLAIGCDWTVAPHLALSCEVGAMMTSDHFNSKRGRGDNPDFRYAALIGLKYTLGATHGRTAPIYRDEVRSMARQAHSAKPQGARSADNDAPAASAAKTPAGESQFVDVPVDRFHFSENIYFTINQTKIRDDQMPKLYRLLTYLENHPRAFVRLSGYADRDTGTPLINERLSEGRSQAVKQWLQEHDIQTWRLRDFAFGDRVQPSQRPEENRVCVCYVYDPDVER